MKLYELFGRGRTVFSCEVFPPKKTSPEDSIYRTLDGLKDIKPDFISVTFGAGGSQVNQTTWEIASIIQNQYHIPAMAHLTCVGAGRAEADETLAHLKAGGVENILALRGDVNPDVPPKTDFAHASDLVSYLRSHSDFGVSAACYPEGHLESPDLVSDSTWSASCFSTTRISSASWSAAALPESMCPLRRASCPCCPKAPSSAWSPCAGPACPGG